MPISMTHRSFPTAILLTALCASPLIAEPKKKEKEQPLVEGRLVVDDGGGLFSQDGIKRAKSVLADVKNRFPNEMHVLTIKELSASKKKELEASSDKPRFWSDWAKEEAKGERARGVVVLICRSPGHINVLVDKQIRDKGFTTGDEERVRELLLTKFRESIKLEKDDEKQSLRDKGLLNAAEFVRDAYKKMSK